MKQRQYQEAAAIYRSLVASDPADRTSKLALATALANRARKTRLSICISK